MDALTTGQIMNALRVRDELADKISRVSTASEYGGRPTRVGKAHAELIAERLIEIGFANVEKIHDAIVDGTTDDDDLFDEEDED